MPRTLDPNRPLLCRKCGERKPATLFKFLSNNKPGNKCESCRKPPSTERICLKCKEVKPHSAFSRTGTGIARRVCDACFAPPRTQRQCARCDQIFAADQMAHYRSGFVKPFCQGCDRPQKSLKKCIACLVEKPFDLYHRTPRGDLTTKCFDCYMSWYEKTRRRPIPGLYPCLQCGHKYMVDMPPSQRDRRKYCGEKCRNDAQRSPEAECNTCLRRLPADCFNRRPKSRSRNMHCKECDLNRVAGLGKRHHNRTTACNLLRGLRATAHARQQKVRISLQWVEQQTDNPCYLCGDIMSAFIVKDKKEAFDSRNVVPACGQCRYFASRIEYVELVQWALLVAEGQGWAQKDPQGTKKRKRKAYVKSGVANHPHFTDQSLQPFNEPFEDKVRRFALAHAQRTHANSDAAAARQQERERRSKEKTGR